MEIISGHAEVQAKAKSHRRFGPGGDTTRNHRFEHLRGGNDRLAGKIGFGDELLLRVRNRFDRHFHAEIAACDHNPVSGCQNFVEVSQRV